MKQKRLLILGAMAMHVPIIKRAKERGIYVITCDYIPENIGHKYADEAYFDSTTDLDAVLNLAKRCEVDGVMTYNSDPAALTAAYVSEKLGLPGNSFESVKIMSEKDLFRKFLAEHGFNTPRFGQYSNFKSLEQDLDRFTFPVMVKPVDSSGSKGVNIANSRSDVERLFNYAMEFTRCKRVIVEEYIIANGAQLHGDAFVENGVLSFSYLGDHHFNSKINNLVPISTTFPSLHSDEIVVQVERTVQDFIDKVGFKQGGINIEARVSGDNQIYLIEVGPRNGGNFTPAVIGYASGFNFIDSCLDIALSVNSTAPLICKKGFFAYMIIHSEHSGILDRVEISCDLQSKILERHDYVNVGGRVNSFTGAGAAIGVLILRFDSMEQMLDYTNRYEELFTVVLK